MIAFFVGARTLTIKYWDCIFIPFSSIIKVLGLSRLIKYLFIKDKV